MNSGTQFSSLRTSLLANRAFSGVVKVDFAEIRWTLSGYISELRRSYSKVRPEMNESGLGLSNAHFNIPNGCLTKKLQLVEDRHKIDKIQDVDTRKSWKSNLFCETIEILDFYKIFGKFCFDFNFQDIWS